MSDVCVCVNGEVDTVIALWGPFLTHPWKCSLFSSQQAQKHLCKEVFFFWAPKSTATAFR